jgi:hypothetical protein
MPSLTTAALTSVLLALGQGGGLTSPQAPPPNPSLVRVFVHTEDAGESSELSARRDSVKDLTAALANKKKSVAIVESEDAADVVVEIVSRGTVVPKVVIGLTPRGQPPGANVRVAVLQVRMEWLTEKVQLSNKNKPNDNPGGWKSAAGDVADQIDKWINERRAAILRARGRAERASSARR